MSLYETDYPARRILARTPRDRDELPAIRDPRETLEAVRRHLDEEMAKAARRFDACVGIGFGPVKR